MEGVNESFIGQWHASKVNCEGLTQTYFYPQHCQVLLVPSS
jgi:hypothetical protein